MSATNQITIKVRHGDDIRRFKVDEPLQYSEMFRQFRVLFTLVGDAKLSYIDEDLDTISITNTAELEAAIKDESSGRILRVSITSLKVVAPLSSPPPSPSSIGVSKTRKIKTDMSALAPIMHSLIESILVKPSEKKTDGKNDIAPALDMFAALMGLPPAPTPTLKVVAELIPKKGVTDEIN